MVWNGISILAKLCCHCKEILVVQQGCWQAVKYHVPMSQNGEFELLCWCHTNGSNISSMLSVTLLVLLLNKYNGVT